jgi:hypothetical protein
LCVNNNKNFTSKQTLTSKRKKKFKVKSGYKKRDFPVNRGSNPKKIAFGFGWETQNPKNPESKPKKNPKIHEIQNQIYFLIFKFKI